MTNKLIVLLDCDGVISDFITPALEAACAVSGMPLGYDDVTEHHMQLLLPEEHRAAFMQKLRAPGFCASLPIYDGALDAVRWLTRGVGAEVKIVTQPMSQCPTWEAERQAWVDRHFATHAGHLVSGGQSPIEVIHTGDKHLVGGHLFVDDNPKNVDAWQAAWPKGLGLLWSRPYNRGASCPRVDSWRQVLLAADMMAARNGL